MRSENHSGGPQAVEAIQARQMKNGARIRIGPGPWLTPRDQQTHGQPHGLHDNIQDVADPIHQRPRFDGGVSAIGRNASWRAASPPAPGRSVTFYGLVSAERAEAVARVVEGHPIAYVAHRTAASEDCGSRAITGR